MTLSIYILIAVYSVVYSYRRLNRPGVSKKVRFLFFRKHFWYVFIFTTIWSLQQCANFYYLFNPVTHDLPGRALNRSVTPLAAPMELLGDIMGFRGQRNSTDPLNASATDDSDLEVVYL